MKESLEFIFTFYQLIEEVNPMIGSRTSVWVKDDRSHFMPCEFTDLVKKEGIYKIKVRFLDSERFRSNDNIGKTFYFGLPNYIIGYGILEAIQPVKDFDHNNL